MRDAFQTEKAFMFGDGKCDDSPTAALEGEADLGAGPPTSPASQPATSSSWEGKGMCGGDGCVGPGVELGQHPHVSGSNRHWITSERCKGWAVATAPALPESLEKELDVDQMF